MAFCLRELFDRNLGSRRFDISGYEQPATPRATYLLWKRRQTQEETLSRNKPTDSADALRRAFVDILVEVDDRGEPYCRPAPLTEIPRDAHQLIEQFVNARLLSVQSTGDATTIEVAHEAMFRAWPKLTTWLDEERDFMLLRRRIEDAYRMWASTPAAQQDDALLSGLLLERAVASVQSHPGRLDRVQEFIQRSWAKEDRDRSRRRAPYWLGGLAILGLLAQVAGIVLASERTGTLLDAQVVNLRQQAQVLSALIAAGDPAATGSDVDSLQRSVQSARPVLEEMRVFSGLRARVFDRGGAVVFDSAPPPLPDVAAIEPPRPWWQRWLVDLQLRDFPRHDETSDTVLLYQALNGLAVSNVWRSENDTLLVSVATAILRDRLILGAIIVSSESSYINEIVAAEISRTLWVSFYVAVLLVVSGLLIVLFMRVRPVRWLLGNKVRSPRPQ